LRFIDLGGAPRKVTVTVPMLAINRALETDAVERNQRSLPVEGDHRFAFEIRQHEIVTIRLAGNPVLKIPAP